MGIRLSNDRYEEIKRIIVNMFVKYNVSCVPVSGFELATKMGIKVIPYSAIPENKRPLLLKKVKMDFAWKRRLASGTSIIMMQKIMAESIILLCTK